jgi:hypothetical protein
VKIDRALTRTRRGRLEQRHHRGDALRGTRLADLRHVFGLDHVHRQLARPVRVVARHEDLALPQARIAHRRLLELLHEMLAFDDEMLQLLAEFLLVQPLDVFEFHVRSRATASATLMPSTPADRMPPA